ncbi:hypothetical protein THRCLA_11947, partial [Thraustotheca clavata]
MQIALCTSFKRQLSVISLSLSKKYRLHSIKAKLSLQYLSVLDTNEFDEKVKKLRLDYEDIKNRYKMLTSKLQEAVAIQTWRASDIHVEEVKTTGMQLLKEVKVLLKRIKYEIDYRILKSTKKYLIKALPNWILLVFQYLPTSDIGRCLRVCSSWHAMLTYYGLLSQSIKTPEVRWQYWRNYIPFCDLCYEMFQSASKHDDLILKEVERTTFYPKDLLYQDAKPHGYLYRLGSSSSIRASPLLQDLQQKLINIFQAYACFNPHVGYGHGMTFIASTLLTCLGYDVKATFVTWALLMEHRLMKGLWDGSNDSFGLGLDYRLHQLTYCIYKYLPKTSQKLQLCGISTPMFATSWILSLFLNERSLPPQVCAQIIDAFIQEGWYAMFALYIGLLLIHEPNLPSECDTISVLNFLLSLPRNLENGLGVYRHIAY